MKIFKPKNFCEFIHAYIGSLPKKGRGEITRIADHLRVSTTLVSQVLAGKKLFTPEQGQLLIEYLGLQGLEADFVMFLLHRDRSGSNHLKRFWNEKIDAIREQSLKIAKRVDVDRVLTDQERAVFYSNPLFSAIRLYTSIGLQGKGVDEIVQRFDISRAKALTILGFLVETGLCRSQGGRYFMGIQKTHLEEDSPYLLRHHCNWRLRSIRQSEDLKKEELMYTAPVSLSKRDFENLREEMVVFIKRFLACVHDSPADDIACFNIDFFWIRK
jgi:hypothetical protein